MGKLHVIALAMKDRLEEIPALSGKVVVYRRADIKSQFERAMSKVRGVCVVIQKQRGRNRSTVGQKVRWQGVYTVSLFVVPTENQHADAVDSDTLVDAIADKLQGWWPDNVPSNRAEFIGVGDQTYPDDAQYDVTTLIIDAPKSPN